MNDTVLISRRMARRLQRLAGHARSGSGLPPDLLRDIYRRLRWAALIYAATYALAYYVPLVIHSVIFERSPWDYPSQLFIATGSILYALFVYTRLRLQRFRPETVVRLGLVFEVVSSLGISAAIYEGVWLELPVEMVPQVIGRVDVTWLSVWICIFPLIVPAPARKTFIAAFLAASTGPATILASWAFGGAATIIKDSGLPPGQALFHLFYPTYLCVGLAVVVSQIIYKLNQDVSEARQMGSYRLVERLGEGGMGEVWKAEHTLLARPAAIKLIRPQQGGADLKDSSPLVQRFEREASAIASLSSPHTIALYDFGVTEDRTFYYVMELLNGFDLHTLVDRFGPQPPERVVHILVQACRSLHEAHRQGLIHRDVKPANLFLCEAGGLCDFVKVLDFGLVKYEREDGERDITLTTEGVATGTPLTMAPEVALGGRRVDERVDIYGLGCVAYWLLTGRFVFEGETAMQMVARHIREEPVPPSLRTELPVPGELDRIVLDCLAKDPGDRPASARELMTRLLACPLPERWTEERAERWWKRNAPAGAREADGPAEAP